MSHRDHWSSKEPHSTKLNPLVCQAAAFEGPPGDEVFELRVWDGWVGLDGVSYTVCIFQNAKRSTNRSFKKLTRCKCEVWNLECGSS